MAAFLCGDWQTMIQSLRSPGLWLGTVLTLVAALLFVDLNLAAASQTSRAFFGPERIDETGVVDVTSVGLSPGDVMRLYPQMASGDVFGEYHFYIVEAGEGNAFLQNQTPAHIYVHEQYRARSSREAWINPEPLYFQRPDPPPGFNASRIDMVWVLSYAPDAKLPTTDEGWSYFRNSSAVRSYYSTPWATESWAVSAHKVIIPVLYVLAAAAAVLALVYVRHLWKRQAGGDTIGAEAGLELVDLGGRYLSFMRAFLIGLALPLAYVCWASLFFVWGQVAESPAPNAAWGAHLQRLTFVILGAVVLGWVAVLVRVTIAHRRWKRLQPQRPLEA